jgi:dTMP kinase
MISEDHVKIYSNYWKDVTRGIKTIPGVTEYGDGLGNLGYDYYGYELGGYTDGDPAFQLYTKWGENLQGTKLKYSWCAADKIVGIEYVSLQMRNGMFLLSPEEFVEVIRKTVEKFKAQYPDIKPAPRWSLRCRPKCVDESGKPLFIVFEGVDNSGKTTISKKVAEYFPVFKWRKEPNFTTEEADRLNSDEFKGKDAKREVFFLEGRIENQKVYNSTPCLLDRYLWSGMAYAKAFSPTITDFCDELYSNFKIFRKPSLTFFMETPLETCYDREEALKKEPGRLERIRQAYRETEDRVGEVVYIDGTKSIDECAKFVIDTLLQKYPDLIYYTKENW